MIKNNFTKFAINYLDSEKKIVYAYTAYDIVADHVLQIKRGADFEVPIPATIQGTCGPNFKTDYSTDIEAYQFWDAYRYYILILYEYYQKQST